MTWDERHNDLRFLGLNVTPHIAQNERRRRAPPSTANPRGTRGLRHQPAETQANRGAIWLEHDHLWPRPADVAWSQTARLQVHSDDRRTEGGNSLTGRTLHD
jgi:hypothetical protein